MSDLQKAFVKAKLAKYPQDIPVFADHEDHPAAFTIPEEGEGEDFDSSSTSSASSAGTVVPSSSRNLFAKPSPLSVCTSDILLQFSQHRAVDPYFGSSIE